jgi:hypothetical protein
MDSPTRIAVKEFLLTGEPITELESNVLFGVPSLKQLFSEMRREGFIFEARKTNYATALRRINQYASLTPPENLPIREIHLTEWWISK